MRAKFRVVIDEPLHAPLEPWELVNDVRLQRFCGKERDESHHRAHFQRTARAVWQVEYVVEKTILFVPQSVPTDVVRGICNVDKMLEKFTSNIFIGMIVTRQFKRNSK